MSPTIAWLLACLLGFTLGAIPVGLWWGRLQRGIDIREHGSRNLGATNVYRVLGPVPGILVLLLDIGKGAAAVGCARLLTGSETAAVAAGLLAILGHMVSPLAGFRGGKGVAAGLGAWLLLAPAATGLALASFAVALLIGRRVSPASLLMATVLVPAVYHFTPAEGRTLKFVIALISAGLIWYRHRGNVIRLIRGEEPPLWGRRV
jgi:glycerol-3-phosphate acyltransferase PlsY